MNAKHTTAAAAQMAGPGLRTELSKIGEDSRGHRGTHDAQTDELHSARC